MIQKIIDLHIHSKYSRACSKQLELPNIAMACEKKGIDIVSTGDFTHPLWFKHLEENLVEDNEGIYRLKLPPPLTPPPAGRDILSSPLEGEARRGLAPSKTRFVLGTEISCIYKHKEKTRRLHLLIFAPNLETAKKFNIALESRGVNIKSDGRPMMGLHAKEILKICLEIDERMMVVPAHAWTPWFAVFGSKSGYDTLEDCFEELTPHIRAIETGLSSDPVMNRRLSMLDDITLISNSDAHGLENLGREANVFGFENEKDITYSEIRRIVNEHDAKKFLYTIEFYPEEGKYHLDGHAACGVVLEPAQTKKEKGLCPKCKRPLTVGVLHRVDDLADRNVSVIKKEKFIPHQYIVPLRETIGQVLEVGVGSKKVKTEYDLLIKNLGSEFYILLKAPLESIAAATTNENITRAIENMRTGKVVAQGGYDGIFGKIDVLGGEKIYKPKQSSLL
jgi:DNA helicase-2/ATP-dependent DNA helicase PcrA